MQIQLCSPHILYLASLALIKLQLDMLDMNMMLV